MPETKNKGGRPRGIPFTDEHRARLSASHRAEYASRPQEDRDARAAKISEGVRRAWAAKRAAAASPTSPHQPV